MSSILCENVGSREEVVEDLIPKKVRFRDKEDEVGNDMLIDSPSRISTSWRDKLVGKSDKEDHNNSVDLDAFDFIEGDIQKTVVNGVPSITFFDRIHQILLQGMENTVVIKFLGRNIGFSVLQNKIYNMWRPLGTIHMMGIENGYFLVKFQNKRDCEKALAEGPWIIFGQYLTVQPWTMTFDTSQAYPSVVMACIRFSGFPNYLYNSKIIIEIGESVGKVDEPNSESVVEVVPNPSETTLENPSRAVDEPEKINESYGPWMIVERKSRRKFRDFNSKYAGNQGKESEGSRFIDLNSRV
ncbi:hypothetical protein J1N35_000839 [Gossypium stocksii]|uniref:DUF4283 domain-containing protein n=1 Tax=Gossypium stocksii TaxID=47602 RepID=A0A9D3WI76_9ROSI|nr:hypothetical protein J1N35_000839 [Gossypium stocksii]